MSARLRDPLRLSKGSVSPEENLKGNFEALGEKVTLLNQMIAKLFVYMRFIIDLFYKIN